MFEVLGFAVSFLWNLYLLFSILLCVIPELLLSVILELLLSVILELLFSGNGKSYIAFSAVKDVAAPQSTLVLLDL